MKATSWKRKVFDPLQSLACSHSYAYWAKMKLEHIPGKSLETNSSQCAYRWIHTCLNHNKVCGFCYFFNGISTMHTGIWGNHLQPFPILVSCRATTLLKNCQFYTHTNAAGKQVKSNWTTPVLGSILYTWWGANLSSPLTQYICLSIIVSGIHLGHYNHTGSMCIMFSVHGSRSCGWVPYLILDTSHAKQTSDFTHISSVWMIDVEQQQRWDRPTG